jgi:hypothetical protein
MHDLMLILGKRIGPLALAVVFAGCTVEAELDKPDLASSEQGVVQTCGCLFRVAERPTGATGPGICGPTGCWSCSACPIYDGRPRVLTCIEEYWQQRSCILDDTDPPDLEGTCDVKVGPQSNHTPSPSPSPSP